jgi:hypothetical protein
MTKNEYSFQLNVQALIFKQKQKTSAKLKILHEAALILNSGKKRWI